VVAVWAGRRGGEGGQVGVGGRGEGGWMDGSRGARRTSPSFRMHSTVVACAEELENPRGAAEPLRRAEPWKPFTATAVRADVASWLTARRSISTVFFWFWPGHPEVFDTHSLWSWSL